MKKMLKLNLILILLVFLIPQNLHAKEIKFVQITDSHYSTIASDATKRDVRNSKNYLGKAISDINGISNLDFVVFTGDNIDQANPDDLKIFLDMANKLNAPYYVVIGNHEVFKSQNLTKKDYMKIVRKHSKIFSCKPRSANYVFSKKGIIFIVVDGAKEVIPGPAGYFKVSTLKWLDKKLRKYRNNDVVILQHFPVEPPYYNRTHKTYKVEDYKAILKKYSNVIAVISGHYHANGEKMVDGVYHISTPALVEPPHNYKIIEIESKIGEKPKVYTRLRHAE